MDRKTDEERRVAKIYEGRRVTLEQQTVKNEAGKKSVYDCVRVKGAVAVLAITEDNQVVLVRQHRYPVGVELLEVPAGVLDVEGETPEQAARRELQEETGYTAHDVTFCAYEYPSAGFCDEVVHLFIARGLSPGQQRLEDDERGMKVILMPVKEAIEKALLGEITDSKTLILLLGYGLAQKTAAGYSVMSPQSVA